MLVQDLQGDSEHLTCKQIWHFEMLYLIFKIFVVSLKQQYFREILLPTKQYSHSLYLIDNALNIQCPVQGRRNWGRGARGGFSPHNSWPSHADASCK